MAACSVTRGAAVIDRRDADLWKATWTADELIELREMWTFFNVHDLAVYFKRTEYAVTTMYYRQANRPTHERFTPSQRTTRAWGGEEGAGRTDNPPGPFRTIHADEDEWWTADYYRRPVG